MKRFCHLGSAESAKMQPILPFSTGEIVATVFLNSLFLSLAFMFTKYFAILICKVPEKWCLPNLKPSGVHGILFVISIILLWKLFRYYNPPCELSSIEWMKHFWRTNVVGYYRFYGINPSTNEMVTQDLIHKELPNSKIHNIKFWIGIPWGGYKKRPKLFCPNTSIGWLKIRGMHGSLIVTLIDSENDAITAHVETILKLIGHDTLYSIDSRLTNLIAMKTEIDALKETQIVADKLLTTINCVIQDIIESQRFIKSVEGWNIAHNTIYDLEILHRQHPQIPPSQFDMPKQPRERHKKSNKTATNKTSS